MDELKKTLDRLRVHADVLMRIPASEQHIGNIQSVVSIALLDVVRAIEQLENLGK